MGDVVLDLFGDPVPVHRGRKGRPAHVPTAENRLFVTMMLATGHSIEEIAGSIVPGGISLPTLRKHYFSELMPAQHARLRVKGQMLVQLAKQATSGNTGAAKEVHRIVTLEGLATKPVAKVGDKAESPPGVKEARRQASYGAHKGTSWDGVLEVPAASRH